MWQPVIRQLFMTLLQARKLLVFNGHSVSVGGTARLLVMIELWNTPPWVAKFLITAKPEIILLA